MPISKAIKKQIESAPIKGKLVSLVVDVSTVEDLEDVFVLLQYKQSCT